MHVVADQYFFLRQAEELPITKGPELARINHDSATPASPIAIDVLANNPNFG
jgi:hypothetical protein